MNSKIALSLSICLGLLASGAGARARLNDPAARPRALPSAQPDGGAGSAETAAGKAPAPKPLTCDPGTNLVNNPGFETGYMSGWSFMYNVLKPSGALRNSKWEDTKPAGHPAPTVINAASATLPHQGKDVDPYCGNSMLRINDLKGQAHATRAMQRVTLGSVSPCARLRVSWGAMLQDPQHPKRKSPKFNIQVIRIRQTGLDRFKTIYQFEANARNAGADGWEDIRVSNATEPVWYKTDTYTRGLGDFKAGEKLEIRATVTDCSEGLHGGAAFLDCVEVIDPCSGNCPDPDKSPIADPILPNFFSPNGDGINDELSLPNVHGACRIRIDIYDRSGRQIAWNEVSHPSGYAGEPVAIWNGYKRNKKGRWLGPAPMSGSPYDYVIELKNCVETRKFPGFVYVDRCLGALEYSDEVSGKFLALTKAAAVLNWRKTVKAKHSKVLSHWLNAGQRDITCERRGSQWHKRWYCVAHAVPCRN